MSIVTCNGRFHTAHPYAGEKGNKFEVIYNLNLVEASHSKILASVLIVICRKEMVKSKDYKSNYHLTTANCQSEF